MAWHDLNLNDGVYRTWTWIIVGYSGTQKTLEIWRRYLSNLICFWCFNAATSFIILKVNWVSTFNYLKSQSSSIFHNFIIPTVKWMEKMITLWQESLPRSSRPRSSLCLISPPFTLAIHFSRDLFNYTTTLFSTTFRTKHCTEYSSFIPPCLVVNYDFSLFPLH